MKFKNWRTASSEIHRVLGVWGLLFNCILAITGFWLLKHTLDVKSHFSEQKPVPSTVITLKVSIDHLMEKALHEIKNLELTYIYLPRNSEDNLIFYGDTPGNALFGKYNNSVAFNPNTGAVIKVVKEDDLPLGDLLDQFLYTLHFGAYGGLIVKALYSLFGLMTSVVSITGCVLWYKRKYKKRKT
jgi:uncharacterized iron-regulated membrane protein